MQRSSHVALGALLLAAVVAVVFGNRGRSPDSRQSPDDEPIASAAPSASAPAPSPDSGSPVSDESAGGAPAELGSFGQLPDGGPVPTLPDSAPKRVRVGVIIFRYQGAQAAPKDAPTKAGALARAKRVLEAAQEDFADAVKKGDPGSTANAGSIPRGILEPSVEYAVFGLAKGDIYPEPLDTPRGYWLVKRTR